MLDPNRPPTHRSEEPEHETVIWDRLRAEAESSRGSSVFPAAKLSDASESVYLEYDDDELLEAMHADADEDDQGPSDRRPSQLPQPTFRADAPDFCGVGSDDDELADEDLSDELSALTHLTHAAHAAHHDDQDEAFDDAPLVSDRSSSPPLLLQGRASQPPMLPSRSSQPPLSTTRSSQPGIMDRTLQPPNDRERSSQPPSYGYTYQAGVSSSLPAQAPSSGERGSRPPLAQTRSSQPPAAPRFIAHETDLDSDADAFATTQEPSIFERQEPSIFERTQELFERPNQSAAGPGPGARWEQAWADWDKQFDIPALALEPSAPKRSSRLLVPAVVGLLALVGLGAAGSQLLGSSEQDEASARAAQQAQAAQESEKQEAAAEAARTEAAIQAADDALKELARADAALKAKAAQNQASASGGGTSASSGGGQVAVQVGADDGMSKAARREREREERRAARREARHRRREERRAQERAEAAGSRSSSGADAPATKSKRARPSAEGDDPLYGIGEE